ncbi:hypothetical protein P280DRAFT_468561 [Massarina eburnea CBS 473.64]|uniref:Fungal N-terminal domain-containing protein n=1 Tax=Massarina eburnea CBS 473.64 TaxID=1395130 RepID=A0A6A6S2J3_9PLEO|nr:hypothetical protein P280DRAFT_468561 [Massarina eburnea CBS 473.64]
MADPIIGAVSLALELYKGLSVYVGGVRSAEEKTTKISEDLERLAESLEAIKDVVEKMEKSPVQEAAGNAMDVCDVRLRELEKKVGAKQAVDGVGLRQRMRGLGKRLVFPFKQDEINAIQKFLESIKSSLQLVLLALQLEESRKSSSQISDLLVSSHTSHRALTDQISDSNQTTLQQLSYNTSLMQLNASSSEKQLVRVEIGLLSRMSTLEDKIDQMSITNFSPPAVNRTISSLDAMAKDMKHLERTQKSTFRQTCTCRGQSTTKTYLSWPLKISRVHATVHNAGCRYATIEEAVTSLQFRFTMCSIALRRKAEIGLALAHGAGSSSVSPMLKCDRVVLKSSPGFRLLGSFQKRLGEEPSIYAWEKQAHQLYRLFELRKASPHDRLPNGMTLLHYFCYKMHVFFTDNVELFVPNYYAMGKRLLEYLPTQATEKDEEGKTVIDYFVRGSHIDLVEHFVENGVTVSVAPHMVNRWRWEDYGIHISPEAEDILEGPEQLKVILVRSEPRLLELIKKQKTTCCVEGVDVPLYAMATNQGWTRGCEILLEHGVKVASDGKSLLKYAMSSACREMIVFWLNTRDGLTEEEVECVGSLEGAVVDFLCTDGGTSNPDALTCISALVKQRQELGLLAVENFIEVRPDRLVDAQAQSIIRDLEDRGVYVKPSLKPEYRSVYLNPNLDRLDALQTLYDVGFHDTTVEDYQHLKETFAISPFLFSLCSISGISTPQRLKEVVLWYLEHGTDLRETWPGTDITIAHCIGYRLGNDTFDMFHTYSHITHSFATYFSDTHTDNCHCPCSTSGCRFITSFCKGLTTPADLRKRLNSDELDWRWRRARRAWRRKKLNVLACFVDTAIGGETCLGVNQWLVKETIRFVVFHELGIRHTCCDIAFIMQDREPDPSIQPIPRYQDVEELSIIQKEDEALVKLLEELVEKYQKWWDGGDWIDGIECFFEITILPHIDSVLRKMRDEDRRWYAEGRKGLGVQMMGEDESEESSDESSVETEDESDEDDFDDEDLM